MKKTKSSLLFLLLWIGITNVTAQRKYPCASKKLQMKFVEEIPLANHFDPLYYASQDSSFRSNCLCNEFKDSLTRYLDGTFSYIPEIKRSIEPAIERYKEIVKILVKSDTTRYKIVYDSLIHAETLEYLSIMKKEPISKNLPLFAGKIYYYPAIPYLKKALRDSSKHQSITAIRLALARLGDIENQEYFYKKYTKLSKTEDQIFDKENDLNYINTQESQWLLAQELKNTTIFKKSISVEPYKYDWVFPDFWGDIYLEKILYNCDLSDKECSELEIMYNNWMDKNKPVNIQQIIKHLNCLKGHFSLDEVHK